MRGRGGCGERAASGDWNAVALIRNEINHCTTPTKTPLLIQLWVIPEMARSLNLIVRRDDTIEKYLY